MPCGACRTRFDKAFLYSLLRGYGWSYEQKICPRETGSDVAGPTKQGSVKKKTQKCHPLQNELRSTVVSGNRYYVMSGRGGGWVRWSRACSPILGAHSAQHLRILLFFVYSSWKCCHLFWMLLVFGFFFVILETLPCLLLLVTTLPLLDVPRLLIKCANTSISLGNTLLL